jgi:hypothetical protein
MHISQGAKESSKRRDWAGTSAIPATPEVGG